MMVAAMSIACGSVEDKAKEFEQKANDLQTEIQKATEAGDMDKVAELTKEAAELAKEYDEWYKGLSEEDKKKLEGAEDAADEKDEE